MTKCLKPNFSISQYSGDINLTKLTGETPEALVEEIYARLKGLPFSTSMDESQNEDLYLESVTLLVNTVVNKLKDINPDDKKSIRELLKSKLSPRPLTQVEERIQAVIEGTDLISEQERRAITYKAILNDFYKSGNLGIDLWRQMLFTDLMLVRTIIDASKRLIIDSDETLNQGIINYQSELYKIIRDYLLKYVFTNPEDSKLFSTNLYVTNPKTKVKTKVSNYANALQAMYNVITDMLRKGTFNSELEQSWANAIQYKNSDFYNAVSAYINLTYFDDVLYESLGDFIIVDNNLDTPITAELNELNKYEIKYKYKLRKGNTNNKKNFGVEFQDSLDLMSKFSKVLINSIPVYDYRTGLREFGKMLPKDFIGTWTKLKDVGTRVNDDEFVEAVTSLHNELSRTSGSLKTIYNKLFNDKYNSTLLRKLNELGFDLNNLNILYSFYKTAMYGKNSWLSIENDYLKNKGIRPRYNLIESLFNVISSNSSMNYLQTTYDSYNDLYETKVKDKYSISLNRFDIVKDINSTTIDREDSLDYKIVRMADLKSHMINIDGNNYFINIPTSTHLLAKKGALSNYLTPEFDLLNVDISTLDKREHLINGTDLTEDEIKFKQILNFLDNMLHTSFSKDTLGLLELYLASLIDENFLKGAFLSASRALLIRNIYNGFRSAKKEDGSTYAQNELRLYLKDNPDVYPVKIANYSESRDINEFFIKSYNGYQLKTVLDREDWIMNLAKVRTILAGNTSKSVISNLDGDKVPNFSPTFLGAEAKSQIVKSGFELNINSPTLHLLFSKFPNALIETVEDTDVRTKEGIVKQVKSMTEGELLYHSIVDKFLIPLVLNKTVYIQPTVYSDKTKYINGHISLEDMIVGDSNLYNIMFSPNMLSLIEQLMIDTIGNTYKEIYNNVIEDYLKIFPGKTDLEIANELKKLNEELLLLLVTLYNKAHNTNLVFYRDLHYRQVLKGKLALNELLYEFAKNLYTPERLHNRLEKEKREYINDLLLKRIHIPYTNTLQEALKKFVDNKELDKWTSNGKIVLARAYNPETKTWRNVIYGRIKDNEIIEINPMLNAVFMYDNLLGNNLRYSLSGTEINHKIKSLKKLNLLNKIDRKDFSNIRKLMPGWNGENITFLDLYNMIYTNTPKDNSMIETILRLSKVYDDNIYMLENLGLNALFKRNVAITATMTRMIPNLYGITYNMNIACMDDVPAKVFNFDGKIDKIDAHDGSALVIPFWAILENKSLSDNEVGTIKKPIHHYYNDRYMTATLLKYATDAITNLWMRQSEGNSNGIRLRDMFKKATRVRWHDIYGNWRFGEVDLIDGCAFKKDPNIDFKNDICDGLNLYYRNGNTHFLIYNFGIENGVYYTDEQEVDNIGKAKTGKNPIRKYHYFNNNLEHVPSNVILTNPDYHTIDSLFELHTALGGIYSESLNADGNLQYSEASNYAVTNFINLVSNLKLNSNPRDLSPVSYDLPLKRAMIHMIANNSAIKNGAGNMNPVSSWYNDTDLNYMTIGTEWYGIQLDSDHTADEAVMTEFSLVINSLDAGGFMHDYVKLIYELLGLTALDLSRVELDSVKEFRKTGNKTAIVDIIGRTLMANLRSGRGQAGLAEAIISNLRRKFNLSTDHTSDEFKIPFSDPSIYNIILSTFVSNINRKSIKRQYPGLGTVMAPGYNMSMIYDLGGNTYQFEDLVNLAYSKGFNSALGDVANKNRDVVSLLLASEQLKLPSYNNAEIFIPTDNVLINFTAEKFNLQGLNTNEVEYEVTREPWREDESKDDNDPTKRWKDVLKIYIKGHKEFGSFDLVKDLEFGFFSVHFKTGDADTGETYGSTPELRNILYLNLYDAIPEGAQVSTWGNISQSGLDALNKLMTRFTGEDRTEPIIANREILDRQGNPIEIPVFLKFGSGLFNYEELTLRYESVSLDSIEDYYSFKADPIAYLKKLGYYNISNVTFLKNIMVPRNLAPAKISYEYDDETGHHYSNIFDHWRVASLYKAINYINNSKKLSANLIIEATLLLTNAIDNTNNRILQDAINKLGVNDINNDKELIYILRKYYNPDLAFRELKDGYYIKSDGTSYNIINLLNLPAELIMSNIYKTAFGIKDGDSLIDVMNKGVNYFLKTPKIISSDNFDLVYTKNDNKHLYITFKPLPYNSDNFDSSRRSWKNIIRKREPDGNTVNRIFATTDDNVIMFEVGREVLRDDVVYDLNLEKFTLNGNILENQSKYRIDGDNVLEYIEFVSNNIVSEINGDKHSRYRLYNINKDNIIRAFNKREYTKEELLVNGHEITPDLKFDSEVNNYISKLLADIYNTDAFNGVLVNSDMSAISGEIVNNTLYNLGENLKYDQDLSKYIKSIKTDILNKTKPNPKNGRYQIKRSKLNDKLREFTYNLASKKYASFLKSLYFTASRIPALNLQSFMKMKCVGFTGTSAGQCFVSHW